MRYLCVEPIEGFTVGFTYFLSSTGIIINDAQEAVEISIADLIECFEIQE